MDVSVCMATYNGEKFIKKQLVSILDELDQHDELVIVDDCSKDQTVQIIKSFNDNRIKLYILKFLATLNINIIYQKII